MIINIYIFNACIKNWILSQTLCIMLSQNTTGVLETITCNSPSSDFNKLTLKTTFCLVDYQDTKMSPGET